MIARRFAFFLLLATPILASQDDRDEQERKNLAARENPILRDYFRRQYYDGTNPWPTTGPPRANRREPPYDRFVERFVDRRIDHFVEALRKKIDAIDTALGDVHATSGASIEASSLRQALRELSGKLGGLHKMLSHILIELNSKSDFKPRIPPQARQSGYAAEVRFIEEQIDNAFKRIENYFFEPTFTVRIDQLQDENMMIALHRAERMAKELQKSR